MSHSAKNFLGGAYNCLSAKNICFKPVSLSDLENFPD